MTDIELVELMSRWEELQNEYANFLESDECKRIEDNGNWAPDILTWVTKYRD